MNFEFTWTGLFSYCPAKLCPDMTIFLLPHPQGGYNFLITVDTSLVYMNHVRVMFGNILADSVKITGDKDQVKGKVPRKYCLERYKMNMLGVGCAVVHISKTERNAAFT